VVFTADISGGISAEFYADFCDEPSHHHHHNHGDLDNL